MYFLTESISCYNTREKRENVRCVKIGYRFIMQVCLGHWFSKNKCFDLNSMTCSGDGLKCFPQNS